MRQPSSRFLRLTSLASVACSLSLVACRPSAPASALADASNDATAAPNTNEIRPTLALGDAQNWLGLPVYQDSDLYASIAQIATTQGIDVSAVTMEMIIAALPQEMRDNFTLLYASKSLQKSTDTEPRALLYMRNGTFVAAFNTVRNDLEFLQYNLGTHRYELGYLNFPLTAASIDYSANSFAQQDKSGCVGGNCHKSASFTGAEVPKWGHYPDWPGVYGGYEDLIIDPTNVQPEYIRRVGSCQAPLTFENLAPDLTQSQTFFDAKKGWLTHPRYGQLFADASDKVTSWPYDLEYRGLFTNRANLRFGSALQRNFVDSIMTKVESNDAYYQQFKYMYLYGYAGCEATADQTNLAALRQQASAFPGVTGADSGQPLTQLFVQLVGIDPDDTNFSEVPMSKPGFGYDEGFVTTDEAIAARILAGLSPGDQTIGQFFHFQSIQTCYPGYGDDYSKAEDMFGVNPVLYEPNFAKDGGNLDTEPARIEAETATNQVQVCAALASQLWPQAGTSSSTGTATDSAVTSGTDTGTGVSTGATTGAGTGYDPNAVTGTDTSDSATSATGS